MDDDRVWAFEENLWTADAEHYRESIDDQCLMALPMEPFVMSGQQSIDAVTNTPRWSSVELDHRQVARPEEGLIIVAYRAVAARDDEHYEAYCTSTYRRLSHEEWRVVQHSQVIPPVAEGKAR